VPRSGLDAGERLRQSRIGVSYAHAYTSMRRDRDEFQRTFELRRSREHADATGGRVPHLVEQLYRRRLQVKRRMNSASSVTDKRTFQMDAQRTRTRRIGAAIALGTLHSLA